MEAARAGKHVSVQKPMALDLAECDAMIAACREAGVALRVYENFVFYPPYVRARRLLEDGAIGEPRAIRMKLGAGRGGWPVPLRAWLWRLHREESGGGPTIFDDGYHKLSIAVDWLGPVRTVRAYVDESLGQLDAPAVVAWTHDGGRTGLMDVSFSPNLSVPSDHYPADERVEVVGTEGWIRVSPLHRTPRPRPAPRGPPPGPDDGPRGPRDGLGGELPGLHAPLHRRHPRRERAPPHRGAGPGDHPLRPRDVPVGRARARGRGGGARAVSPRVPVVRRLLATAGAETIRILARLVLRLPDARLAALAARGERLVPELAEVATVFRGGPPHSDLARRAVLDARPAQLRSILRGHLLLGRSAAGPGDVDHPSRIGLEIRPGAEVDGERIRASYPPWAPPGDGRDPSVEVVEVVAPLADRPGRIRAHSLAGRAVVVSFPPAASAAEARRLRAAAPTRRVPVVLRWAPRAHPAVLRARALLAEGALGELQGIRIGVLLGRGDHDPVEALEPLALALDLAGPIRCLSGTIPEPVDGEIPPAVILWKHARPGLLGALDLAHAPGLEIPGGREIRVELTGTDGILFVEGLAGRTSEGPSLRLYRGRDRRDLSVEIGTGAEPRGPAETAERLETLRLLGSTRTFDPDAGGWALALAFLHAIERLRARGAGR